MRNPRQSQARLYEMAIFAPGAGMTSNTTLLLAAS
jgi:hypothetical protein